MMMPPPSSNVTPISGHGIYQHASQDDNQLNQQMQNMKLNQPMAPHNSAPYNAVNSSLHSPGNLSPMMQQSPQHSNRSPVATTVTYSSQPHVTYPYGNNNPQSVSPHTASGYATQPPTMAQKSNINNNVQSTPNANVQPQHGMNQSIQLAGINNNQSNVQPYPNPPGTRNGNFTNGYDVSRSPGFQQSPNAHSFPSQNAPRSSFPPPSNLQQRMPTSNLAAPRPPAMNLGPPAMNQGLPAMKQGLPAMNQGPPGMNQGPPGMNQGPPGMNQGPPGMNQVPPGMNQGPPGMNQGPPGMNQGLPAMNQNTMYNSTRFPNVPPSGFSPEQANSPYGAQPPSMGSYPPNASPYGGMQPGYPNTVNPYPNAQYQGEHQPMPGSFNYGAPVPNQQQQPRRLDLDQMPNTVLVRGEDRKTRSGPYATDTKGQPPPLVTTDFVAHDRGMCNPRFIRASAYCLPNHPDMLKQTAVPFALTVSPLADLNDGETEPPLCLYREEGPLRCKRCKAYVCPFMNFLEGGRCFQCAFCKVVTEVPQDYFCFLDGIGERTDKYHRPELCLGSYEYIATKEYCRKEELPNPPAYIFMMEVSHATFRNGLVPLLCENMKNVLQCLKNDEKNDTSKLRIGFVTYNSVLHFYNMKKNLTHPHIMVLSDVHNAFVPLLEGFLVTLDEAELLVDCLMEHIPKLFVNETATEIILGPVIQVGLEALKNANCSGKLFIFHATLPNADAPGKLQHRDGQKLLGTDKQKTVILPQSDFYSKLAEECVTAGCAVDLFLFPNAYIDIASISPVCRHTGGQLYKYTYFQAHVDGERFLEDLERNVAIPTAFDAVLRLRTSAGISPVFYYGNFYMSNATDIELSTIDRHKAVTIELAYDDKLPENETVYMQAALLYTSCTGERRIRVHNLAIATSVGMPDVYKCCELDTIINFLAKQTLKHLLDQTPQQIKTSLINRSVKMLSCYRKNCASSTASGQLILPDSMKLLPLYINCLLKSDAIGGGPEMTVDDRSFAMLAVNSMDVKSSQTCFYPHLIPLHDVDVNSTDVPDPIRCSIEKLSDEGAYILENGIYMFLWIGQAVDPEWLNDVFGVPSTSLVEKEKTSLPELNTPLSLRIRQIIDDLQEGRQWYMRLTIVMQGDKREMVFRQFLIEDKGVVDGSLSYVDFLCQLHREISKNL